MIHSALSITLGIDFMVGKKSSEKRTSGERKYIVFYITKFEPKEAPFWNILQFTHFCGIICGKKGRENESLMVNIAS